MNKETQMQELLKLLDEAEQLASEYTGGYSGPFFSAQEFHRALSDSIAKLKNGYVSQLKQLDFWFLPTSCWDDFIHADGQHLADQISSLLSQLRTK